MNPQGKQVVIVGAGPVALILALMLHKQGAMVTVAGEPNPDKVPMNPELALLGGDDILPAVFQRSLKAWRTVGSELGLDLPLRTSEVVDLATSAGRMAKLKDESLLDALGGENVTFVDGAPEYCPTALGYKLWKDGPLLGNDIMAALTKAVGEREIGRLASNAASLSLTIPGRPKIMLENGMELEGSHVVFASARALRKILPPLGLALPLRPARGHVIMLETSKPHGLPMVVQRLQRGHLFVVPAGLSRIDIYYDAINDPAQATFNVQHSPQLVSALLQHAVRLCPTLDGYTMLGVGTLQEWLTPDFRPALGPWPGMNGLFVATGWGGRAMAMAAGAAGMLSEAIMHDGGGNLPEGMAPNRFANGLWEVVNVPASLDWKEPIDDRSPQNMMSAKPDYAQNVQMIETPKAQYATNVQQVEKVITESAGRRPVTMQGRDNKKKIVTAGLKNSDS